MTPRVVLIGPMGAGKSTVGAALARRLGCDFHDTDVLISAQDGREIREIFVTDGEAHFRELERTVIAQTLQTCSGVVALGGGAILDLDTRADIRRLQTTVVFLDITWKHVGPRVGFNTARPLLLGSPRQTWIALMNKRRQLYTELASMCIDTGELTCKQVVAEIVTQLEETCG